MEKSPFFPSLLQSALPSSIIILSGISLLYRRAFVTVDLPNFTRLPNRPRDVTERNERRSAGASGFPLCRYNASITYIYTRSREIALSVMRRLLAALSISRTVPKTRALGISKLSGPHARELRITIQATPSPKARN